jgi:ABC-type antimicrobial peptide transport system ATPase subunit
MKVNCPACKQAFEGETELAVTLELVKHMKSLPADEKHRSKLSPALESLDRVITFASTVARDDAAIRSALYDKCANLDMRLQTLYLYATSHLAIAAQASRDMLLECGDKAAVREQKAAKRLWGNLREALLVAERTFRQ